MGRALLPALWLPWQLWRPCAAGPLHFSGLAELASGAPDQLAEGRASFDSSLDDWLAAVKFEVPDDVIPPIVEKFHVVIAEAKVKIRVHGLQCDGLRIGTLRPSAPGGPPDERAQGGISSRVRDGELELALGKVSIRCKGTVAYSTSLGLSGSADAVVQTQDASVGLRARLNSSDASPPLVPDAVLLSGCSSALNLQLEIVAGTAWTEITTSIPGVVEQIQAVVNNALEKLLCGSMLASASERLNSLLREAHDLAWEYMQAPGAPPGASALDWDESYVPLQDVPLIAWIVQLEEEFERRGDVYNSLLDLLLPGGRWPVVGQESGAFLPKTCLLGGDGDKGCAVARSLHHDPPAVLHAEVERADVAANFSQLTLVAPTNATLRSQASASQAHLRTALNLTFNGWAGGAEARGLQANLGFSVDLRSVDWSSKLFVGLNRTTFDQVPTYSYMPLQCIAPSFHKLDVMEMFASFGIENLTLRVLEDSREQSPLLLEATELVNNVLSILAAYDDALVSTLNGYMRSNLTEAATNGLNQWAAELRERSCPEPMGQETNRGTRKPLVDPALASRFMWMALAFGGLTVAFGVAGLCCRRGELRSGSGRCQQQWFQDSLCSAASVHWALAPAMIVAILACIFFLAGSNFLLLAETFVTLEAETGSWLEPRTSVSVYEVMVYSLFYSFKKLVHEGGGLRFLAYVLIIFSGILPYTKLLTMLFCWLAPARLLPLVWRGRMLLFMDQIGKFSLIDVFVIQFISATLYTSINVGLPSDDRSAHPLSVVLRTNQDMGFTSFVLATVGSLVIGHVCLRCHERDPAVKHRHDAAVAAEREQALRSGLFQERRSLRELQLALSGRRRRFVVPALVLAMALAAVGCLLPAFSVTLSTPLGVFSEASYSVVAFAAKLPDLAEEPNSFTARFGQGTFIFFMPASILLHLAVLLTVWFYRFPAKRLSALHAFTHMLFAWSALDVGVISMVMTLIEMTTTDFVRLNEHQKELLSRISGTPVTTPHGLTVGVQLGAGTYLLAAAALLHAWIGRMVMGQLERAAAAAQRQQEARLLATEVVTLPRCDAMDGSKSSQAQPGLSAVANARAASP